MDESCLAPSGSITQVSVSPMSFCAGDRLSVKLSNLKPADNPTGRVRLIIASSLNYGVQPGPSGKGLPPNLTYSDRDLVLASAPIAADGSALLETTLLSRYGPDPSGKIVVLDPGKSNAEIWLNANGGYSGLDARLCPAAD